MKTFTLRLPLRGIRSSSVVGSILALGLIGIAQAEYVFHVSPSGDLSGETDWANVMLAFENAKAAGPGSKVKMARGTFYIPRPLQIANFSGTLQGAGKGKTILRNAPGVEFGVLEPPLEPMAAFMVFWLDGMDPSSATYWPADRVQDLTISSFTIVIDGPAQPWYPFCMPDFRAMNFIDVRGRHTGLKHPIWDMHPDDIMQRSLVNAQFKNLELIGKDNYGQNGTQVWGEGVTIPCADGPGFIWIYTKWISGSQVVKANSYDSLLFDAISFYNLIDSTVLVGGSRRSGITIRNGVSPLFMWDLSNTSVHASHINAVDSSGVGILHGIDYLYGIPRLPDPSEFVFAHNRLQHSAASNIGSFELYNYAALLGFDSPLGSVVISDNKIRSVGDDSAMGIYSSLVDDVVIAGNRIKGKGLAAIVMDSGRDCVLDRNGVHKFEATPSPEQIHLGAGTSNCTVVVDEDTRLIVNDVVLYPGESDDDDDELKIVKVLDMGTDNQFLVGDDDDDSDSDSDSD